MDQSSEQSADLSMDQDDGRWLSYPELAAVRGIDKASAIRLASRQKWRRQRDNRRVVRVLVPTEWLSPRYQSVDQPMDQSRDQTDFTAAFAAVQAAHAGEVAALHGQVTGLRERVDDLTGRLADAQSELARLQDHARQADAAAQAALEAADELRRANEARAGQGRWARLRAAWRGE